VGTESSILGYVADASLVVKCVMILLLAASMVSWTLIFQRHAFLKQARKAMTTFEDLFWSGIDLNKLYTDLDEKDEIPEGLEHIFQAGFQEFLKLREQPGISPAVVMEGAQRAMRIAYSREMEKVEQHLSFLATVGSTSPYVGIFGTVWGIMASFHGLIGAQSATIAMVAPGISEAFIATAMGLFAAIPSVIFYNRFANDAERLLNYYDTFQEEFSSVLYRQAHAGG
jgi:biopolymer transport protein TolQ